ncbi:MAG: hypothetical protein JSV49_07745 [Thermoplasmata archaeon]|nr:MAG: hypothetical protein JSV49_07745 [Thermoplasmata archaeon]
MSEGVQLAIDYYNKFEATESVLAARRCIAKAIRDYHKRAGILDDKIEAELAKLTDPAALVVEVAHQPNIFPFSGYYKKLVLGKILGDRLSERLDVPVSVSFGFVDQDFANPKWFRRTNLPDIYSQEGVLVLKLPVSRRTKKAMHAVPPPDDKQVQAWKTVLENWLTNNIRRFNKMIKSDYSMFGYEEGYVLDKGKSNVIRGRMNRVYELIDECQKLAGSITEFNGFFTARLTHHYWQYPILFYDYSKIQYCFEPEYRRFLTSGDLMSRYAEIFAETYHSVRDHDITFDFNLPPGDQAPLWYQCKCGGKIDVSFDQPTSGPEGSDTGTVEFRYDPCPECGAQIAENFEEGGTIEINERASPRAAFRPILIANTLQPSIFVSGLAASGFHMISRGIASELSVPLPPYIIWPGGDDYRSLAKMVAELTKAQLEQKPSTELTMKDKKILDNYPNTISTIPSIIDYLVNIGPSELAAAWEEHLINNNDLTSVPKLPSLFDS